MEQGFLKENWDWGIEVLRYYGICWNLEFIVRSSKFGVRSSESGVREFGVGVLGSG